jgi:hypothetical protein
MAMATALDAIKTRLQNNWTTTTVVLENQSYTPEASTPYVTLAYSDLKTTLASLGPAGSRLVRRSGTVVMKLAVPLGSGGTTARQYADSLAAIFEMQNFSGVVCMAAATALSDEAAGSFYRLNVSVPFRYDELA